MGNPSLDPEHTHKETRISKDSMLTIQEFVCLYRVLVGFAQWRAHTGRWDAQTLFCFSQMFIYTASTGTVVQALDLPDLGLFQTIQDMRDSYTQTTALRGLNCGVRSASKRKGN